MTVVAEGYNVFDTGKQPQGVVKYLHNPQAVISLIKSGKLNEHILLVRGGTTTFLAPGPVDGRHRRHHHVGCPRVAPRHPVPRVPDPVCDDGAPHQQRARSRYVPGETGDAHFAEIVAALDGKTVTLDCTDHDTGRVVLNG